ncbi:hypothetical protein LH417_15050 [Laribacter hongkongensis]|uniref:hypothetical protein n=1 Tax=Laribacter hongkongensis TaxID=168471 RepID=UPI001EFEE8AF|nr:hypothetical protein [Laribacter hongkongensis]MCG9024214.1 hypothetical protein [Laribacter hongkongensis]
MDFLTFLTKLAEFLAWPAVVAFIFYRLTINADLATVAKKLFSRISKFQVGAFSAEFQHTLQEAEELSAVQPPSETTAQEKGEEDRALQLLGVAEISPRAAVLDAWTWVEDAAQTVVNELMPMPEQHGRPMVGHRVTQRLSRLLPSAPFAVYNDLRRLRNNVAHGANIELPKESAEDYVRLCRQMIAHINNAKNMDNASLRARNLELPF